MGYHLPDAVRVEADGSVVSSALAATHRLARLPR